MLHIRSMPKVGGLGAFSFSLCNLRPQVCYWKVIAALILCPAGRNWPEIGHCAWIHSTASFAWTWVLLGDLEGENNPPSPPAQPQPASANRPGASKQQTEFQVEIGPEPLTVFFGASLENHTRDSGPVAVRTIGDTADRDSHGPSHLYRGLVAVRRAAVSIFVLSSPAKISNRAWSPVRGLLQRRYGYCD